MADLPGRAVTYVPTNDDFRELLLALHAYFDAGNDDTWSLDGTVTFPTLIASAGDTGFALTDGTNQILIADHAAVGGTCLDGGALAAADDLVVALVPGGGTTDMRSGSFAAGARFSGWAVDCQGVARSSHAGRCKISSGTINGSGWLSIRFKTTDTNKYAGGFFAGMGKAVCSGIPTGFFVGGGLWTDLSTFSSSARDHAAFESFSGTWVHAQFAPLDTAGLQGDFSTDGAGNFAKCPVLVMGGPSAETTTVTSNLAFLAVPGVFASAVGTLGAEWLDGATTKGFNVNGGSWVFEDDGTDAE